MKKTISRVGVAIAAVGAVSAVGLAIVLNQPTTSPISPKPTEASAISKTQEKPQEDTKDKEPGTVAVATESNNEAPTHAPAPVVAKAKSVNSPAPQPAAETKPEEQTTPAIEDDKGTDNTDNIDNADNIDNTENTENNTNIETNDEASPGSDTTSQTQVDEELPFVPPVLTGAGGRWTTATNTYPYKDKCPRDNNTYTAYNGNVCQCTSYASWKAYEKWGVTAKMGGHARSYVNANVYVPTTGINTYVDNVPAPYTIAVQTGGAYGHVMWVESVNPNGTMNVTEYNVSWASIGCYAGDFCSRQNIDTANTWFVHFE